MAKKKIEFVHKFTNEDGEAVEIHAPKLSRVLNGGFSRRHRHETLEEQLWLAIEEGLDEENLAKFDNMTQDEVDGFLGAWQEEEEATAGES